MQFRWSGIPCAIAVVMKQPYAIAVVMKQNTNNSVEHNNNLSDSPNCPTVTLHLQSTAKPTSSLLCPLDIYVPQPFRKLHALWKIMCKLSNTAVSMAAPTSTSTCTQIYIRWHCVSCGIYHGCDLHYLDEL